MRCGLARRVCQHQRLCRRCAQAAQRLSRLRARAGAEALARRAEGLGRPAPCRRIKKLGPGDFSTPAPSLAAGGEVLIEEVGAQLVARLALVSLGPGLSL